MMTLIKLLPQALQHRDDTYIATPQALQHRDDTYKATSQALQHRDGHLYSYFPSITTS